jgi:ubiquinone/menaquinone biosynthesis C-methylase UbiE
MPNGRTATQRTRQANPDSIGGAVQRRTDMVERKYRRLAPIYDWLDSSFEKRWKGALRPLLFEGLSGRILDVGAGTGLNIAEYPPDAEMTAVDISAEMLEIARRRADDQGRTVRFLTMDATHLSLAAESFDHVVGAFLFCNLPTDQQRPALAELARVVRPGGTIRLLDYRLADRWADRLLMRLRGPWLKLVFGAQFDPRTEQHVEAVGLKLQEYRVLADGKARLLVIERP